VPFSIPGLLAKFRASPTGFFKEFGLTGWHGIIGWAVTVPIAGVLLYFFLRPLTQKLYHAHVK
jgi:hypothetical protein